MIDIDELCGIKKPEDMNFREKTVDYFETIWYRYFEYAIFDFPRYLKQYLKNLFRFSKALWRNYDFDFRYMLILEQTKLKQLSKYFETANIVENEWAMAKQTRLAYKLIDIILQEGGENIKDVYVNIRNASRYLSPEIIENLQESDEHIKGEYYLLTSLRYEKAWKLYCKLRENHMRTWWD